jgi:dUTP pyrophosphatase
MSEMNYLQREVCLDVKKLHPDAILPTRAHVGDLGYDLYALEDVTLEVGVTKVRTGVACHFPSGYGVLIRDRSSVATKQHVIVVAGVVDEGYTGEIIVAFFSRINGVQFDKGQKIAQMIPIPVINWLVREVDDLAHTSRGANGFGSSGVN